MKTRRLAAKAAAIFGAATISVATVAAPTAQAQIPETSAGAVSSEMGLPAIEYLPLMSAMTSAMGSSVLWGILFPDNLCGGLVPYPCAEGWA